MKDPNTVFKKKMIFWPAFHVIGKLDLIFYLDLDSRACFVKSLLTVYICTISLFFKDM